jgi:hypothetical protein
MPQSTLCSALLEGVERGKISGYTSAHVISEAIHKIMLAEAAARFALNRVGLNDFARVV